MFPIVFCYTSSNQCTFPDLSRCIIVNNSGRGRHILCAPCSAQLYTLKWTTEWNRKYCFISRLVHGITTKGETVSKLSS